MGGSRVEVTANTHAMNFYRRSGSCVTDWRQRRSAEVLDGT